MMLLRSVWRPIRLPLLALMLIALAVGTASPSTVVAQATPTAAATPMATGVYLSPEEIAAFAAVFTDQPLTGGQVPPRIAKFVTPDVFIFLQFDKPDPAQATALRYVGI